LPWGVAEGPISKPDMRPFYLGKKVESGLFPLLRTKKYLRLHPVNSCLEYTYFMDNVQEKLPKLKNMLRCPIKPSATVARVNPSKFN